MNIQQIMEYLIAALVVAGMIILVALQRIDVTIAVSTMTLALGYAFGAAKSSAVLSTITPSTPGK